MINILLDNLRLTDYKYGYQLQEQKTKDNGETYLKEPTFYPTLSMAVKYARKKLRTNDSRIIETLADLKAYDDEFLKRVEGLLDE